MDLSIKHEYVHQNNAAANLLELQGNLLIDLYDEIKNQNLTDEECKQFRDYVNEEDDLNLKFDSQEGLYIESMK